MLPHRRAWSPPCPRRPGPDLAGALPEAIGSIGDAGGTVSHLAAKPSVLAHARNERDNLKDRPLWPGGLGAAFGLTGVAVPELESDDVLAFDQSRVYLIVNTDFAVDLSFPSGLQPRAGAIRLKGLFAVATPVVQKAMRKSSPWAPPLRRWAAPPRRPRPHRPSTDVRSDLRRWAERQKVVDFVVEIPHLALETHHRTPGGLSCPGIAPSGSELSDPLSRGSCQADRAERPPGPKAQCQWARMRGLLPALGASPGMTGQPSPAASRGTVPGEGHLTGGPPARSAPRWSPG